MKRRTQTDFSRNKTAAFYTYFPPFFQEDKFIIFSHELTPTESPFPPLSFTIPSKIPPAPRPPPPPKKKRLSIGVFF